MPKINGFWYFFRGCFFSKCLTSIPVIFILEFSVLRDVIDKENLKLYTAVSRNVLWKGQRVHDNAEKIFWVVAVYCSLIEVRIHYPLYLSELSRTYVHFFRITFFETAVVSETCFIKASVSLSMQLFLVNIMTFRFHGVFNPVW